MSTWSCPAQGCCALVQASTSCFLYKPIWNANKTSKAQATKAKPCNGDKIKFLSKEIINTVNDQLTEKYLQATYMTED